MACWLRFGNIGDRALTLAVSPPGFGKTTLLTQWRDLLLQECETPVAWLSLDEADAEVGRFLSGLLLTLRNAGLDTGGLAPSAQAQALDRPPSRTVSALLQALARDGRRFWLVLDDYHRAAHPEVDRIVLTLVEQGSQWLHLVVSSRSRPAWPLAALNARGMVFEISANDLVLSLAESAELFGPAIGPSAVATLHAKTEGWAVAMQLARLWMTRGSGSAFGLPTFSGRVAEVANYLAEQVVDNLPADCRDFLVETSLLENFNAELADAARARDDSGKLLARLRSFDALLIPLDASHSWFRYHLLLVDFLQPRLDVSRAREIHRAAAVWLARREDWARAVTHALRAGDAPLGARLVLEAGGWSLVLRKGIFYTQSLVQQFDHVARRSDPALLIVQAYLSAKQGNEALATELLRLAEGSIRGDPRLKVDFDVIRSMVDCYFERFTDPANWPLSVRSAVDRAPDDHLAQGTLLAVGAACSIAWGRLDVAVTAARDARACMRLGASPLGETYCVMHEAIALSVRGEIKASHALIGDALALAEEHFGTESSLKAMMGCFKAQHLYWAGQWQETQPWVRGSEEVLERTDGWLNAFAALTETAWRTGLRQRGLQYATEVLDQAAQRARDRNLRRLTQLVEAWRVDLLAQCGLAEQAQREAQAAALDRKLSALLAAEGELGMDWRFVEACSLALARLSMATGASQTARICLDRAAFVLDRDGLKLPAWRVRLLCLLAERRANESDLPRAKVLKVMEPIVNHGLVGLVLEAGAAVLPFLKQMDDALPAPFRAVFTQLRGWQTNPPRRRTQFSPKEEAVLQLLMTGQSNKLIARALDVSENTIKFHLKRIFQKLEVDDRAAAMAAALQQGFAPVQHHRFGAQDG